MLSRLLITHMGRVDILRMCHYYAIGHILQYKTSQIMASPTKIADTGLKKQFNVFLKPAQNYIKRQKKRQIYKETTQISISIKINIKKWKFDAAARWMKTFFFVGFFYRGGCGTFNILMFANWRFLSPNSKTSFKTMKLSYFL